MNVDHSPIKVVTLLCSLETNNVKLQRLVHDFNLKKHNINHSIRTFLSQISSILEYIHYFGINHRDVKPDNIKFNSDTNWYILINRETVECDENLCNGAGDIWALAITTLSIWYSIEDDRKLLDFNVIRSIRKQKLLLLTNNELDSDIVDVLVDMLDFDSSNRITASQIIIRLLKENTQQNQIFSCNLSNSDIIANNMRGWIKIEAKKMNISPVCIFTSYIIVNKLSDYINFEFILSSVTCIIISSEIHDEYLKYEEWVKHCNNCFTKTDLINNIRNILIMLNFNIFVPFK